MIGEKISVDDFIKENYILDIDLDCFVYCICADIISR